VRLPLATLTVVTKQAAELKQFSGIIAEELNVKSVKLVEMSLESADEFGVVKRLTVNSRAAGPRIGKSVQAVIQASKSGDWSDADGKVVVGGVELIEGEYAIDLVAKADSGEESTDHIGILPSGFLILDGAVSPELAAEGLARDVIRAVQNARKEAGLDVSDRIKLTLTAEADVLAAVNAHAELVKSETLTVELDSVTAAVADAAVAVGEGQQVAVLVEKL
jgi:isoleucyl-tRNA synthetase